LSLKTKNKKYSKKTINFAPKYYSVEKLWYCYFCVCVCVCVCVWWVWRVRLTKPTNMHTMICRRPNKCKIINSRPVFCLFLQTVSSLKSENLIISESKFSKFSKIFQNFQNFQKFSNFQNFRLFPLSISLFTLFGWGDMVCVSCVRVVCVCLFNLFGTHKCHQISPVREKFRMNLKSSEDGH